MAWIEMIDQEEAKGKLKKIYDRLTGSNNPRVANILKIHSLHPEVLEAHLNLYRSIMFGKSGLSRAQREMIAVVVSNINACDY